jgi:hypothetical protein
MKTALRVLVGALVGTAVLWTAAYLYGLLAVWTLWPDPWWAHRYSAVSMMSKALAFLPGVFLLGFIFTRLFRTRPVLFAAVTMSLVLLVAYADMFRNPALMAPMLRLTWEMLVSFLLGPPLVVYLMSQLRNNRWRGP